MVMIGFTKTERVWPVRAEVYSTSKTQNYLKGFRLKQAWFSLLSLFSMTISMIHKRQYYYDLSSPVRDYNWPSDIRVRSFFSVRKDGSAHECSHCTLSSLVILILLFDYTMTIKAVYSNVMLFP